VRWFEILWHHVCGTFASEIATIVMQHPDTVRGVIGRIKKRGVKLVTTIESNHPTSELEKHKASLIEEFALWLPAAAKETASRIETLIGVKRIPNRVWTFMTKIGMKCRQTMVISQQ